MWTKCPGELRLIRQMASLGAPIVYIFGAWPREFVWVDLPATFIRVQVD